MVLKKQVISTIALFCFSVSLDSICLADDRAMDRATLRGIQSVIVKVHSWEPEYRGELKKVGLEESNLQSLIEQKLEKAQIPVLLEEAAKKSETEGILNIRMQFIEPEGAKKKYISGDDDQDIEKSDIKKKYIYAIRLNLRQLVVLPRDPALRAWSITWQTESAGYRRLPLISVDPFIGNFEGPICSTYSSKRNYLWISAITRLI